MYKKISNDVAAHPTAVKVKNPFIVYYSSYYFRRYQHSYGYIYVKRLKAETRG